MDREIDIGQRRRRMRRRLLLSGALIGLAVVSVVLASDLLKPTVHRARVRFATVERGTFEATVQASGAVVPASELRAEVRRWADEMLDKSPTALRVLKHSFNADTESIAGIGSMAFDSLDLFVGTAEAQEGVEAFNEKRPPDFSRYR